MKTTIIRLHAREILDSRGNPSIEVECTLEGGVCARAADSLGASTGIHEAIELCDSDINRFKGKGVLNAVANVNGQIAKKIIGRDARCQATIDHALIELDGPPTRLNWAPMQS